MVRGDVGGRYPVYALVHKFVQHPRLWAFDAARETWQRLNGDVSTGAYLNADFSQGAWISVPINVAAGGTVTVTVTRTAGVNAVVSGIFLG